MWASQRQDVKLVWVLLQMDMMEVAVATNKESPQLHTKRLFHYRQDALPVAVAQSTVSKY